jgi:hypothetical protein
MTRGEARKLVRGVYRVWWKNDGGQSVAAIGHRADGSAWIAPSNWISVDDFGLYWRKVDRVELIEQSPK